VIRLITSDPKLDKIIDCEEWRRREIDGETLSKLGKSEFLIKYNLFLKTDDEALMVKGWITKNVKETLEVPDVEDILVPEPATEDDKKMLRMKYLI